jgi:hypothetical protein
MKHKTEIRRADGTGYVDIEYATSRDVRNHALLWKERGLATPHMFAVYSRLADLLEENEQRYPRKFEDIKWQVAERVKALGEQ